MLMEIQKRKIVSGYKNTLLMLKNIADEGRFYDNDVHTYLSFGRSRATVFQDDLEGKNRISVWIILQFPIRT